MSFILTKLKIKFVLNFEPKLSVAPWAVFNFESRPLEVQVKLYLEPPLLSLYFPFMHWDIWSRRSSFSKIACQYNKNSGSSSLSTFKDFSLFGRAEEDLVETALIESLLHQLYLHCEGEARARGGQSLRVCRILYLSETDCLEWVLESSTAPRVTETMSRNACLVVVRQMDGPFLGTGTG